MNKNIGYILITLLTITLIVAGIVILGNQNDKTNNSSQQSATTNNNTIQSTSNTSQPIIQPQPSESTDEGGTAEESGRCIITVLGNRYDVTELQTSHPGGNIYICGADMTNDYVSQHGRDTTRISPYKL
jgi:cytochrome b involved in lipid metabolism